MIRHGQLEFRSSLYLGMRHEAARLSRWTQLTTGAPAVLGSTPGTTAVETRARRWLGSESVALATSTLHAFTDIYATHEGVSVIMDEFMYPVACLAARGPVGRFRHHDPSSLERRLRCSSPSLVVTEGWCPICGRAAPLARYAELAQRANALLVIDDTQAIGVLGPAWTAMTPFGSSGAGSAAAAGITGHPSTVVVASAAKAFGAPIALVAGPDATITRLRSLGPTRTHSSQPSAAHVMALSRALHINDTCGEHLRRRLARLVAIFADRLPGRCARVRSTRFPVLVIDLPVTVDPRELCRQLRLHHVRAAVVQGHGAPHLVFIIRADHTRDDVARASDLLGRLVVRAAGAQDHVGPRRGQRAGIP